MFKRVYTIVLSIWGGGDNYKKIEGSHSKTES